MQSDNSRCAARVPRKTAAPPHVRTGSAERSPDLLMRAGTVFAKEPLIVRTAPAARPRSQRQEIGRSKWPSTSF